jgi:hypothetical protein
MFQKEQRAARFQYTLGGLKRPHRIRNRAQTEGHDHGVDARGRQGNVFTGEPDALHRKLGRRNP